MAPIPPSVALLFPRSIPSSTQSSINGLGLSSLELDSRSSSSTSPSSPLHIRSKDSSPPVSPLEAYDPDPPTPVLHARAATSTYTPCVGCKPATSFNNAGFLALFGLLGAAMVIAAIWFFFWAKNGGFHFGKDDWDDYKSTVLRRKGPDGKTLSNATKSTKLGGGSVFHGQHYRVQKSIAKTVVGRDEKGRKGILGKRGKLKTHSVTYRDDYMTQFTPTEMSDVRSEPDLAAKHHSHRYRDRDVRAYKAEKPARVGGLNRQADGSHFDYTHTDRSDTYTESSERPLVNTPKKENTDSKHKKAERNAREEAAKMERRWKKEADEAAAKLTAESSRSSSPKKSSSPAKPSAVNKPRRDPRSGSPKKRDFSYQAGAASETLSTAYTATNTNQTRTSSYYDEYRPRAAANPYEERDRQTRRSHDRSRQSSPRKSRQSVDDDSGTKVYSHKIDGRSGVKKERGGRDVMAGYRRGMDSLADSDED